MSDVGLSWAWLRSKQAQGSVRRQPDAYLNSVEAAVKLGLTPI